MEIVNEAIASVNPSSAVHHRLRLEGEKLIVGNQEFDLSETGKIIVAGGGKASGKMAEALEEILGYKITEGVINIPEGTASKYNLGKIELVEAGHPLPTEGSVRGAEKIMGLVSDLDSQDLVICLLSGGGSALMTLPVDGVTLDELQETTQLLLKSGASIQEVNSVRKHLSKIKGGQLARAIHPARSITLIISDVVGDRLDTIASGPTYPDSTTYPDALEVIEKYGLTNQVPESVSKRLKSGVEGKAPETPKPEDECFSNAVHEIIASNSDAVKAAEAVGKSHGFNVSILTTKMQGEAREVGSELADIAKKVIEKREPVSRPTLLISGGETTVTVKGEGKGGRNQELTLSAAMNIAGLEKVTVASFSTDGVDGPTDAAGAVADGFTLERAEQSGLNPENYLERNDSYNFFKEIGELIIIGPTRTNVMDVTVLFVG
ncbi:hypothetical protein AKJ47_02100 [candidate division MSBL1 archaeon SCGC-AAA261G05]|uniref:glycerate 2-kinase n=2 Tax=candidate division MSBL1 TaxID=215777 RepID=A0A133VAQ0_9EURY|nr:hypothetical protein AKJ47_02100 [candidate division MSBL1 archaeon SCGC-AAA261G05]KXB05080.1 hypothetical protein AKJ48_00365 [candidate division MSBL1 archaeon SCGC-AAA261O19]